MKFSLFQLFGFTSGCAVVFWLTSLGGLALSMFLLGAVLTWTVGQIRDVVSIRGGCLWGAMIHFLIARLLMMVGQLNDPLLALALHVVPGAYLGACGSVCRQAAELSKIDSVLATPPASEADGDRSKHELD